MAMIDLHTHTLLSDGALLPSELVRRAIIKGYEAIGLTDHVDISNIDFVLPRLVKAAQRLNSSKIKVIPGVELTHVFRNDFEDLVKYARKNGAKLVIAHGETLVEPVEEGTNQRAIEHYVDILAHPGLLSEHEAKLAKRNGVHLELTSKRGHCLTNGHVARLALKVGAKLVLNSDSHGPDDLLSDEIAEGIVKGAGLSEEQMKAVFENSKALVKKLIR